MENFTGQPRLRHLYCVHWCTNGFSSNGLPIQVVLSNGNGCHASRETLQRVKLLVADSLQKGFHIVIVLAITYFTIGD